MLENHETDVLVIGGGVAGLRAALVAKKEGVNVALVTKGNIGGGSATAFLDHLCEFTALGVSLSEQDCADYQTDLMDYGQQVNDPNLVKHFVNHTEDELFFLKELGMTFDEERHMLPSHRRPRILKAVGEFGTNVLFRLKDEALKLGVAIYEHSSVYHIEKNSFPSTCRIAQRVVHTDGESRLKDIHMNFKSVVVAAGGGGQMYSLSTNPIGATADGTGFALQLGAEVTNLEFIHYLPLMVDPIEGFYIISSVITKGRFFNVKNEEFMPDISEEFTGLTETEKQGQLLLQICQWIERQILEGNIGDRNAVYWDGRHLLDLVRQRIPVSYEKLLKQGIDISKDMIKLSIGCHQMMGGIKIDNAGASTVPGLFAAGEAAGGFQGAQRLMGTGVMDGLVFGTTAGRSAAAFAKQRGPLRQRYAADDCENRSDIISREQINAHKKVLKLTMDKLLVTKDQQRLDKAGLRLEDIQSQIGPIPIFGLPLALRVPFMELQNMVITAQAIVHVSNNRKESRGSFIRTDYPKEDAGLNRSLLYALKG